RDNADALYRHLRETARALASYVFATNAHPGGSGSGIPMHRECGEGCFDSRRRVNSTVLQLPLNAKRLDLPKGETDETVPMALVMAIFVCSITHSQTNKNSGKLSKTEQQVVELNRAWADAITKAD